jgi:hypothetical protein
VSNIAGAAADIAAVRRQLIVLARRANARDTAFSPSRPCEWRPTEVRSELTGYCVTEAWAWELIASQLEDGVVLNEIELLQPPGKKAYWFTFQIATGHPDVYVKLQLGAGKVIGRSFHYSKTADE